MFIFLIIFEIMLVCFIMNINNIILKIAFISVLIILGSVILHNLFSESKNKFIRKLILLTDTLGKLFYMLVTILLGLGYITVPWLFIGATSFGILMNFLSLKVSIYLSTTITLCTMSYFSNYTFKIVEKVFVIDSKLNGLILSKSIAFFLKIPLRKIAYLGSIVFYICIKCITFNGIEITNNYIVALSEVASEILITFVSIDGFIITFYNKIIEKNEKNIIKTKAYLEEDAYKKFNM